jgi:hypothetical protein
MWGIADGCQLCFATDRGRIAVVMRLLWCEVDTYFGTEQCLEKSCRDLPSSQIIRMMVYVTYHATYPIQQ